MPNPHAQALGRLGRNVKKTMSAAAIAQRFNAAQISAQARRKRPKQTKAIPMPTSEKPAK